MIWVRRILTIPLGVLLVALLLVAVIALQIDGTFLDPDFYLQELDDANIYEFVLVDLTTSALDEGRELTVEDLGTTKLDENPLVTLGLNTEDIVSSLNRAIPPEWVQSVVEQVFDGLGQYITGQRDEFTVTVQAGDQVTTMVSEIKSLLRRADAYNLLFAELVTPAIEDSLAEKMPFGLDVTADRLAESAQRVISPEWIQAEVEDALDEITPYIVGERDRFEIKVDLADRVEIALIEVKDLLRTVDAYDLLYDEVVQPAIVNSLGGGGLPSEVVLTSEEITSALRQVAPPDWVHEQAELIIDEAGPYLTGATDILSVDISLVDNKEDARRVVVGLARKRLGEALEALPQCTNVVSIDQTLLVASGELPGCLPPGEIPEDLQAHLDRVETGLTEGVESSVIDAIPDTITYTDAMLQVTLDQVGAADNIDLLDDLRMIIGMGWTYSERDLREDITEAWDDDGVERLDDARAFLADEWSYTEADFRADIVEAGDPSTLRDLGRTRDGLKWANRLRLLIYVPVILVLVAIGFLGGRSWRHRVAWAAAFMVATSALIYIAAGPVYGPTFEPRLDDALTDEVGEIELNDDFPITESLARDKILEVTISIAGGFAAGIATKSLILLVIGLVALGVAVGWNVLVESRRRA